MSGPATDALEESARRIERCLLESGVQVAEGPHRGGVAGWLDRDGRPEFVYLEITGYYLTTMAWLAGGAASSEQRREAALDYGRNALDWLRSATADGAVPPTRLYLSAQRDDWRNAAVFSFDLAMAARGVACFSAVTPVEEAEGLLRVLGARLLEVSAGTGPLASHSLRGERAPLPDRWSTRPGPHQLKVVGGLLRLPPRHWTRVLSRPVARPWPKGRRRSTDPGRAGSSIRFSTGSRAC